MSTVAIPHGGCLLKGTTSTAAAAARCPQQKKICPLLNPSREHSPGGATTSGADCLVQICTESPRVQALKCSAEGRHLRISPAACEMMSIWGRVR
jgi:hypothetical protein